MSRLAQDRTAEPVPLDQSLRRERGKGKIHLFSSAENEKDWQPCPVDPYSYESADRKHPDYTPSSSSTCARMLYYGIIPSLI